MNIHHATRKRAEQNGIEITDNGDDVTATHMASGRSVTSEEPKTALAGAMLAKRLVTEYPMILIEAEEDMLIVTVEDHEDAEMPIIDMDGFNEDNAFADILSAYAELGIEEANEDKEKSGLSYTVRPGGQTHAIDMIP